MTKSQGFAGWFPSGQNSEQPSARNEQLFQGRLESHSVSHAQPRSALGLLRSALGGPRFVRKPPVGNGAGVFGISGTSFADLFQPGRQAGSPTVIELVGKNSPNPNKQIYKDDYNNFGPAIGLSWSRSVVWQKTRRPFVPVMASVIRVAAMASCTITP